MSSNLNIIAWWSGGVTSAVACKLAISFYGHKNVEILELVQELFVSDTQINYYFDPYQVKGGEFYKRDFDLEIVDKIKL